MLLDIDLKKSMRSNQRTFELALNFTSDSQRLVIFGSSGSGKSLTLSMIAGLLKPDAGHIKLAGRTLFDSAEHINLSAQQRNVAFLFQDYALFPHLTVRQNIAFGLCKGLFNPRQRMQSALVDEWINNFALNGLEHQYPREISGGQRQRTALARALVSQPTALLLDEPFSALDPNLRQHMRQELDELQQKLQVPMILITHDQQDVDYFGEQVLHIEQGRQVN